LESNNNQVNPTKVGTPLHPLGPDGDHMPDGSRNKFYVVDRGIPVDALLEEEEAEAKHEAEAESEHKQEIQQKTKV